MNYVAPFAVGSGWGAARALADRAGLHGQRAVAAVFAAMWTADVLVTAAGSLPERPMNVRRPSLVGLLIGFATAVIQLAVPTTVLAAPSLVATPKLVEIPIGETTGLFVLDWDSEGKPIELVFQRSGQPADPPLAVAPMDKMVDIPIAVGEIVTITMQAAGGGRPLTRPIQVTGVQQEAPTTADCSVELCVTETAVEKHGTWARITATVADVKGAVIEVVRHDDGAPVALSPMFLSGGTAQFEVYGLRTGTAYDYTIVVDDYWGNTTQEATGTFVTLRRRVTVAFTELHVIDDSDHRTAAELTMAFMLNGEWSVMYPVGSERSLDTGDTLGFNIVLKADDVGESPSLGWFAEDDDKDAFSGLCSEGVGIGSTGESACYSWITVTDQVDTSSLLDSHSYPFHYQGSNSDSLQLKVSGTVTLEYV